MATLAGMIRRLFGRTRKPKPSGGIAVYRPDPEEDWTDWYSEIVHRPRPKGSLILEGDLLDDILSDAGRFRQSRRWYEERGIPYRRTYAVHGPWGSGKSSLAGVMASELGMSLATLTLTAPEMSDEVFRALLDNLPDNALLLVEDIDSLFAPRLPGDKVSRVTLSGLANAIDGIGVREGRLMVMTTNHIDRVDQAILRPGRVDRRILLDYATRDQARRMFLWFYKDWNVWSPDFETSLSRRLEKAAGQFAELVPEPSRVSPARIQEHLSRFRDDPERCVAEATINGLVYEAVPVDEPKAEAVAVAVPIAIPAAIPAAVANNSNASQALTDLARSLGQSRGRI